MTDWAAVRAEFSLATDVVDFAAMAVASNPAEVASRIRDFHDQLNRSPLEYATRHNPEKLDAVLAAVRDYFGVHPFHTAYAQSTTMALGMLLGGIRIARGGEVLTSSNEHFTTLEALRLRERREGTPFRQVPLFRDSVTATTTAILNSVRAAIRPATRVLALTWVYSSDGVKLPLAEIAKIVEQENSRRKAGEDRLLFVVDGVHGFGVEDATFANLGCDLFAAGCHKWVFGPRGTAIMCGTEEAWREVVPLLPGIDAAPEELGTRHITAGVRAYEQFWAITDAFRFLLRIGKPEIHARVRELATRAKKGLAALGHVCVRTPLDEAHSAGIVSFDVSNLAADDVAAKLRCKRIRITESSWDAMTGRTHARLSISILNSEDEVDRLVDEVSQL
jgi:isopenicillin-N epimerase